MSNNNNGTLFQWAQEGAFGYNEDVKTPDNNVIPSFETQSKEIPEKREKESQPQPQKESQPLQKVIIGVQKKYFSTTHREGVY